MATETTKITYVEGAAASTPAATRVVTYAKADGLMYSKDDAGAETLMSAGSTGNVATDAIWDAAGDLAVGTGANTAARLASGAANALLVGVAVGSAPTWQALASASYRRAPSTGNYTTTSTTFVDVDAANTNLTITTGARRVLITFSGTVANSVATWSVYLDVDLDGTRLGNGDGGIMRSVSPSNSTSTNGSFSYLTDALTAASHTFKLRWRVDGNTGTMNNTGTDGATTVRFSVVELPA